MAAWYPGHMMKTKKIIKENLKLVHAVIELVDARVPLSSKITDFDLLFKDKFRIIVLNKSDLAEDRFTKKWINYFEYLNLFCLKVNSLTGEGFNKFYNILYKNHKYDDKSLHKTNKPFRIMIVGAPNVGKSAFINKIAGKASSKRAEKPGITKGKQWIRIKKNIDLLDMPGILSLGHKEEETKKRLAAVNIISEKTYDNQDISMFLISFLKQYYYNDLSIYLDEEPNKYSGEDILWLIGRNRGCLEKGNKVNMQNAAAVFLKDFRSAKIAKVTLDRL